MSPVEHSLLAVECGHVYHSQRIERVWSAGEWPIGWCPSKCQAPTVVRDEDDQQVQTELNAIVEPVVPASGGASAGSGGAAPTMLL